MFPAVDPIPLPAPVWLMKLLSHVTLALHFSAVMILVGSLALVVWHNLRGRAARCPEQVDASFVLARRMPVVMTWVINLGIPPLLFTQVLYGRAIYSSSVLIGVMWFSIIPLVMLCYWMLYATSSRIEAGKSGWPTALIALVIAMGIGQIYSMNMTLMLRPEVWQQMYANSPSGLQGVSGDPTMMPRWMFVMAGGLVFGGLWAVMLSNMGHIQDGVKAILRRSGLVAVVGSILQIACAMTVVRAQSDAVRLGLAESPLFKISGFLFLVAAVGVAGLAGGQALRRRSSVFLAATGVTLGFLANAGSVIYRDGIRDLTLLGKGFDVWKRTESANWSVLILFLLLFVIMLVVVLWLLSVMKRATAPSEQVNP